MGAKMIDFDIKLRGEPKPLERFEDLLWYPDHWDPITARCMAVDADGRRGIILAVGMNPVFPAKTYGVDCGAIVRPTCIRRS
jgi:hypothetical protein